MPQIKLEYTDNITVEIDYPKLILEVHELIKTIAETNIENCKTRVKKLEHYMVGVGGANKAFVNLECYMLSGRTREHKKQLGTGLLKVLNRHYATAVNKLDLQITVKIADLDRENYFKTHL